MIGNAGYGGFRREKPNEAFVNRQNHSYFYAVCNQAAASLLVEYIEDFCTKPDAVLSDVWWFDDLPGALVETCANTAGCATNGRNS